MHHFLELDDLARINKVAVGIISLRLESDARLGQ